MKATVITLTALLLPHYLVEATTPLLPPGTGQAILLGAIGLCVYAIYRVMKAATKRT